jgi:hypothetical protein
MMPQKQSVARVMPNKVTEKVASLIVGNKLLTEDLVFDGKDALSLLAKQAVIAKFADPSFQGAGPGNRSGWGWPGAIMSQDDARYPQAAAARASHPRTPGDAVDLSNVRVPSRPSWPATGQGATSEDRRDGAGR